jgi:hypothetical protein
MLLNILSIINVVLTSYWDDWACFWHASTPIRWRIFVSVSVIKQLNLFWVSAVKFVEISLFYSLQDFTRVLSYGMWQLGRNAPMFRSNLLLQSSQLRNDPRIRQDLGRTSLLWRLLLGLLINRDDGNNSFSRSAGEFLPDFTNTSLKSGQLK